MRLEGVRVGTEEHEPDVGARVEERILQHVEHAQGDAEEKALALLRLVS